MLGVEYPLDVLSRALRGERSGLGYWNGIADLCVRTAGSSCYVFDDDDDTILGDSRAPDAALELGTQLGSLVFLQRDGSSIPEFRDPSDTSRDVPAAKAPGLLFHMFKQNGIYDGYVSYVRVHVWVLIEIY